MKRDKNAGAKRASNKSEAFKKFESLTRRLLKVRKDDLKPSDPKPPSK